MKYTIITGDNQDILKQYPDNHFDSIVTDPPYGIDFLGKAWDANTGALETYQQCLRVLKPGGHILAFSAARTYHHLAITLEQAGFEIRDQIMWIYSSGFPKSQDVGKSIDRSAGKKGIKGPLKRGAERMINATDENGNRDNTNGVWANEVKRNPYIMLAETEEAKEWSGWGTQLKPAHEPICMARKPMKQTIAKNCQEWGVGAINIDATRVPYMDEQDKEKQLNRPLDPTSGRKNYNKHYDNSEGVEYKNEITASTMSEQGRFPSNVIGDIPDYQKYFYCPKVSRKERHVGFELPEPMFGDVRGAYGPDGQRFAVGFDDRAKGKKKKVDLLAHIPNTRQMLEQIGGYYCDINGNKTTPDQHTNLAYVPGTGVIQSHSVVNTYEAITKKHVGNNHPTVKPVELMKYLIRLVTPNNGKVLDPFCGSGSTGMAAVELGHEFVGCDLDPNYCAIAEARIAAWCDTGTTYPEWFTE
jgi:DNA modification methylase